nr:hypothetical protein [Tanacetum cinerariifolium]
MNFLLTTLKVVYVLTTPMLELLEDATVEAIRIRAKWKNDDYICRGHILNEEYLRVQDSDKGKKVGGPLFNMTEEAGKNKHHKQNKGIFEVVKRTTQMLVVRERGLRTNPKTKVDAIAWWIDFGTTTHVCKDRCWFKIYELVVDGPVLYMGDDHFALVYGIGSVALEFSSRKTITLFNVLYVPKLRHVHYKRMLEMSKDDLIHAIDENPEKCTTCMLMKITRKPFQSITRKSVILELIHSDLCNFHATPSLGNKKAVVRLPDPKQKTWDEKGIDCIFVGYAEHSKAYRFYIIEPNDSVSINSIIESRDAIFDKNHFSLIPRPKDIIPNLDESQRDDHFDDVPNEIEPREDPVEKLKLNTSKLVDQLEYSRATGYFMYAMISTRPDIAYDVGRLKAYSDASWINHVEDSSSTSGWVFLIGGGAISWASKKQTCITGSTIEFEFVALVAAGKETEWLKNLIHEIPIWLKPIAPISIRCDSAPTMARGYSQIYNGKFRHLGVRHSMLPILKKGEYILWTIKMEQYLAHTNYALWEVILNGNSVVQMTKDEAGNEIEVPPVTTHQILARTREKRLRALCLWPFQMSILLDSIESKMLRPCGLLSKPDLVVMLSLKRCFYQRCKLKIYQIYTLSNISLIKRNKPCIDNLDIDDLYKNLKVYEADIKGSSESSSNSQNVAFVSTESTSNTNELNVAYSVSTTTGHSSQAQGSSSYADELMFSFFANQSSTPQLDKENLEQIDQDDLEEIDLKWQMAMLSMMMKRFYKKTRRKLEFNGKEPVGFDKNKVECFNCHRRGHFARDCRSARNSRNMSKDVGNA